MKFTDTQVQWLSWLQQHGGVGYLQRGRVVAAGEESNMGCAISFLNLVAKGAIEAQHGRLVVTDYGRRVLNVPERGA